MGVVEFEWEEGWSGRNPHLVGDGVLGVWANLLSEFGIASQGFSTNMGRVLSLFNEGLVLLVILGHGVPKAPAAPACARRFEAIGPTKPGNYFLLFPQLLLSNVTSPSCLPRPSFTDWCLLAIHLSRGSLV